MIYKRIHHHSAIKTLLYVNQKHYNNSSSLSSAVEKSIIKVVEQHHMYTKSEESKTFRHIKRRQTRMYVVHPNLGVTSTKRCHMPVTFYFIKVTIRNIIVAIIFFKWKNIGFLSAELFTAVIKLPQGLFFIYLTTSSEIIFKIFYQCSSIISLIDKSGT